VWMELLLKLVILCQYNSQIHRVPAGRIVTNKQQQWCQNNTLKKTRFYIPKMATTIPSWRTSIEPLNK
jgi:hypothetical protein